MQDGRAPRVKNRAPAVIQVQERQETAFRAPKQRVENVEELQEFQGRKRRESEERIRRTKGSMYKGMAAICQLGSLPKRICPFSAKRRIQYEEEIERNRQNYDVWFDYTRLEENVCKEDDTAVEQQDTSRGRVREVYERSVAQVPPGTEKSHWRRYIFLWLNYALFEEIEMKDYVRARKIYQTAIQLVPHKVFTFAKLWLMFAKFELRRLDLEAARKILDTAIGLCPKEALFKGYINLEIELREFDRARALYEKYLEFDPANSSAWIKYAELEAQLQDFTRARAVSELGVSQELHMPEVLWKAYIDFEVKEGERELARSLYERLISLSGNLKVWVSYAMFEAEPVPVPRDERDEEVEEVEEETELVPGDPGLARQRVALLEVWKNFEETYGTSEEIAKVEAMVPVTAVRRNVDKETGQLVEDCEFVFPDDERENNPNSFKFVQLARAWKMAQNASETDMSS